MPVTLDRNTSKRIDEVIEKAVAEQRLVGAVVLIAKAGTLVYDRAAGFADRESKRPMRSDSIFRLASLTKTIVSAAALATVERQLLGLDDPITEWLPEFRPKVADGTTPVITVRQLLTHTAGFHYGFLEAPFGPYQTAHVSDGWDPVPPAGLGMEEQLCRLLTIPLSFVPGSAWQYSVGIDILGEILARASGTSLAEVVDDTVTSPLLMWDTAFRVSDEERLATAYADDSPPRRMNDLDFVGFMENGICFSPSRVFRTDAFHSGGGGMVGTPLDYLKFLEAVRSGGGTFLTPIDAGAMMSNQIGDLRVTAETTPSWGFGFGGAVLLDPKQAGLSHSAGTWKWSGLYGHHWFVDPVEQLTVVAMSNTAIAGMIGTYVDDLRNAIYGV